jgi:hypothetical protein
VTNTGSLFVGNGALSASDTVTAAALDNTGAILLNGSIAHQPLLDVAGSAGFGAAGVLSGIVSLTQGAIEFASGQITSIAANAELGLTGSDAFIEDSTASGSNSALTGLSNISGSLTLNGAKVSTTGALANSGGIAIIDSTLSVAGALTNNGGIHLIADLVTEELAGAVGGDGSFTLFGSSLQFDERLGRADHQRGDLLRRQQRAHSGAGAEFRRHDQRLRD